MRADREVVVFQTKLALLWIAIGMVIGFGACWYCVRDQKRPVVEIRLDPRLSNEQAPK